MLADTAIAVHPDDDRYTRLIGETAILPLVGRRLRIIADPYVKPEFGTGALKITPGHDPNDFEIGRAHGLEEITVIGEDGRMTAAAGERFAGMTALEAREAVVEALRARGPDRAHRAVPPRRAVLAALGRADRAADLAAVVHADGRAGQAGDRGRRATAACGSTPRARSRRYLEWMENIRPWCISRQLWWGHQIPVWYRGDETLRRHGAARGRRLGARPRRARHVVLERAVAVRDARLAGADTPRCAPSTRPTCSRPARDILFLWVARMIMIGLEFAGDIPFDDVYVHSIIQAPDGRRMSKSLGTGIDPLDLIDGGPRPPVFEQGGDFPAYGADAVRFGLLAMSSTQDVRFNEEKIAQGRQLANKLWNASRLVLLRVPEGVTLPAAAPAAGDGRGRAGSSRACRRAKADVARSIDAFEFHHAALGLYDFVYGELCDWYLEMIKPRLYADDNARRRGARAARARRDAGARAPDHPVRDRGDLVATCPAPRAC